MNYKVKNFNIILTREFEELEEIEIKPTEIHSLKPAKFVIQNKKEVGNESNKLFNCRRYFHVADIDGSGMRNGSAAGENMVFSEK